MCEPCVVTQHTLLTGSELHASSTPSTTLSSCASFLLLLSSLPQPQPLLKPLLLPLLLLSQLLPLAPVLTAN